MSYKEKSNEIIEKYYKEQDYQYTPEIILLEHYNEFTLKELTPLLKDIVPAVVNIFKSMQKNENMIMQKAQLYKEEYERMCNILNKLSTQGTTWYREMEKTEELLK